MREFLVFSRNPDEIDSATNSKRQRSEINSGQMQTTIQPIRAVAEEGARPVDTAHTLNAAFNPCAFAQAHEKRHSSSKPGVGSPRCTSSI